MRVLQHTLRRIEQFIHVLATVEESEFAYDDSKLALREIRKRIESTKASLEQVGSGADPTVVSERCRVAMREINEYLPITGFLLRSTNIRNAFEVHGPVKRLARQILGNDVQFCLSSEWDYSPLVYTALPQIRGFILLGFPAPESENPLLLPLAGHELGHLVAKQIGFRAWVRPKLKAAIIKRILSDWATYAKTYPDLAASKITQATISSNVVALATYNHAIEWASLQAEECFCDFVGLWLFGASFLHAFEYLLAPNWGFQRAEAYPMMEDRASHLIDIAARFNVPVDADYVSQFRNEPDALLPPHLVYQLKLADLALADIVEDLGDKARDTLSGKGVVPPDELEVERQLSALQRLVPCQQASSFPTIVAAGWRAARDEGLWKEHTHLANARNVLRDILLKSCELFEVEQRQQAP